MKFNPKYVHFMWTDELNDKKAFVADSIPMVLGVIISDKMKIN